jgi:hypothetical protein
MIQDTLLGSDSGELTPEAWKCKPRSLTVNAHGKYELLKVIPERAEGFAVFGNLVARRSVHVCFPSGYVRSESDEISMATARRFPSRLSDIS